MVTLSMLTEVLRRHGIRDPVSKISVELKTPESTLCDWLMFAQQHSLTFKKIAGMTLKQFKEIREQSSQPCARMLQPDGDYIIAGSRKLLLAQRYKTIDDRKGRRHFPLHWQTMSPERLVRLLGRRYAY